MHREDVEEVVRSISEEPSDYENETSSQLHGHQIPPGTRSLRTAEETASTAMLENYGNVVEREPTKGAVSTVSACRLVSGDLRHFRA